MFKEHKKIRSKDISVVIQGPIIKSETLNCLRSVKEFLPDAEIILSTWEGSDVSSLEYDVLVENKDPGQVQCVVDETIQSNLNRQLLSTQSGLKKASREYVLKLRSDLILTHAGFLDYFDKYQSRCDKYKLFDRKIITAALFSIKTDEFGRLRIFHVSDWFYFGLTKDVKKYLINTPLATISRYTPEQYMMISCFKKYFNNIKMETYSDYTPETIVQAEIAMVNNFIILEYKQHGIYTNKYKYSKNETPLKLNHAFKVYFNEMYLKEYKQYCNPRYRIPLRYRWKKDLKIEKIMRLLEEEFREFIKPMTKFPHWISRLFLMIFYIVLITFASITNSKKLLR